MRILREGVWGFFALYPQRFLRMREPFRILRFMNKEGNMIQRRCLVCGEELPAGRRDMRFCSVSCKSKWHYLVKGKTRQMRNKAMRILDNNYAILESLIQSGITSINIPDLAQLGYNFYCVTSCHKVRNREEYRCYDIKYCMSGSKVFRLGRCRFPWESPCQDP